ncbi:MAG: hypothetical protein CMI08_01570 [Oceanospirillaceae bacterium]|uniref:S10 family serine carboxypeptidase-like protein n=3 Tax=unclassified Thalassolituus TaxID=2624967 RepID=UPI000C58D381|nr:hypothetical protein [Thalassolituus sp. UBA6592]MAS23920.1 hypothetical protein [Oceanospirillaceae bacterium]MAX97886.1 hypothetical protein [Oceanospirillaceae bacterium]MBL36333.1 hypothetical protein [Oceanospirillaceae bacterium]|tara:strand:+ start:270 stop:1493 length:1224 start_codon:yes stop_codon:yes gene_type:complete
MNRKSATTDLVTSLPGIGEPTQTQFAGYAAITGNIVEKTSSGKEESLFYWFVGCEDYANKPTIIWTNGGPGSSSFWGFFLENGPYEIVSAEKPALAPRKEAWNNYANYLIFEHPLSVMLSFAADDEDIPANVGEGIQQYYQALINFMDMHPEIAANPIILAGESYAGTYLPLLSQAILDGNQKEGNRTLQLKATVLLDAWVDPYTQMAQNTNYALMHGMISAQEKQQLDEKYQHNLPAINAAIQEKCGLYMTNIAQLADPDFSPIYDYLNRADVRAALHIPSTQPLTVNWSQQVSTNYQSGVNDSYLPAVEKLLEQKLQIMVISGLNDAKDCNFLGTQAWLNKLSCKAAKDFHQAETEQWKLQPDGAVLGFTQNGGQLSWTKVLNAGHMAVRDQPAIIMLLKQLIGF